VQRDGQMRLWGRISGLIIGSEEVDCMDIEELQIWMNPTWLRTTYTSLLMIC
jgi:hypothetical protein